MKLRYVPFLCASLALIPILTLAQPASAQSETHFKIHFDYSKVQSSLFTDDVKRMIESGAALLQSYIATSGEITITVVSGDTGSAYALGAPSEWVIDSDEKSIAKTGGIQFGTEHVEAARDKGEDLTALVMHEIMHCLGSVNTAKAIAKHVKSDGTYDGPNAMKMNKGKPVHFDGSHYQQGFEDVHGIIPRISDGGGNILSILDLAILADLGYDIPLIRHAGNEVPNVHFHYPANYYETINMGPKKYRALSGETGNDILEAQSYTEGGKPGSYVLRGGGGDDVLIAGPGEDQLDANNVRFRSSPKPVVAGKATYVIGDHSGKATVYGFKSGRDKIYVHPRKGVTAENLAAAIAAAEQEKVPGTNSFRPGNWVIKVNTFEIIVSTGSQTQKPTVSDFVLAEWKPSH